MDISRGKVLMQQGEAAQLYMEGLSLSVITGRSGVTKEAVRGARPF
jgi:hypothetical protein